MSKSAKTLAKASEITQDERAELDECIATIRAGQKSFIDVGNALIRVRDKRLYRETDKTFEAFCQREFGLQRRRAYQFIEAAGVIPNLSSNRGKTIECEDGKPLCKPLHKPPTEAQARELSKAPPAKQREAWEKATADSNGHPEKVTASRVRDAVAEVVDAPKPDPEPWTEYNADVARVVELIESAREITARLGKATFGEWIDAKKYDAFWANARVTFDKHRVAGWASDAEKRANNRPFIYTHEEKKPRKVAAA